jgi:P-type Ca2+ transporter type 2C
MIKDAYLHGISSILETLKTNETKGISHEERKNRLQKYGLNALPAPKRPSLFVDFIEQVKNPIVLLLLGTSVIAGVTRNGLESGLIIAIVLFMAGVGVFLERQSQKSLEKLKSLQSATTTILVDGKNTTVETEEIVPGDILVLSEGDKVSADARVLWGQNAKVDEAALTGESLPVSKITQVLPQNTPLADQKNMIFSGTSVIAGSIKAIVVATGSKTELGKITEYLNSQETRLTPLQKELEIVGNILLVGCLLLVSFILILLVSRGETLVTALLTTISLAIAIVPEGLSAVMTITLALAVKEMVKKQVIVKKLLAAEGLGSITHIATDKTGTITEGKMQVAKVYLGHKLFEVSDAALKNHPEFKRLVDVLAFCTNNKGPTEQAMVAFLDDHGFNYELEGRLMEYEFNSQDKRMSVLRQHKGEIRLFSKGAPDILIPLCTRDINGKLFSKADIDHAIETVETLASKGFRVLALADKTHTGQKPPEKRHEVETELTFIGLIALMDPLRKTVKETVHALKHAGITPLMITGDHPAIARYIAEQAGILSVDHHETVLTGTDLDTLFAEGMNPSEQKTILNARVFARVRPEHKVMIVELYQQLGFRIAMTGDGINDAAAIKRADVGIAMSNGMDVTRDIADVVITGAYDALIRAVAIGRTVKLRSQLYIHYLLSDNASEVGIFLFAVLCKLPNPLTPVLLLLINVVTDALPAIALAVEPEDPDVTKQKVKKEQERIMSPILLRGVLIQGSVATILGSLLFWFTLPQGIIFAQTAVFTFLIFHESLRGITARSFTKSVFSYGLTTNYLMNLAIPAALGVWAITVYVLPKLFSLAPLPANAVAFIFLYSCIPPVVEEVLKFANRRLLTK